MTELTIKTDELKRYIKKAELDKIRLFCIDNPAICQVVNMQFSAEWPNPNPTMKRLLEALQGLKEGALASSESEMLLIAKNYIPSDQNLRQFSWYREKLGGAWLLWKLNGIWEKLLPSGELWSRAFLCPKPGQVLAEMYPVPDLAFAPRNQHFVMRCEQVVKNPDGSTMIMDGVKYSLLPDSIKIDITKAPVDLK